MHKIERQASGILAALNRNYQRDCIIERTGEDEWTMFDNVGHEMKLVHLKPMSEAGSKPFQRYLTKCFMDLRNENEKQKA